MDKAVTVDFASMAPIEVEFHAINHLREQKFTNPLKFKKYVLKVQGEYPEYLRGRLFKYLLSASKPLAHLDKTHKKILDYAILIPELIEQGYHGLMEVNNLIYPIKVDPTFVDAYKLYSPDYKFTMDEETDLMNWAMDDWETVHGKKFKGMVAMFWDYGFSGLGQSF